MTANDLIRELLQLPAVDRDLTVADVEFVAVRNGVGRYVHLAPTDEKKHDAYVEGYEEGYADGMADAL